MFLSVFSNSEFAVLDYELLPATSFGGDVDPRTTRIVASGKGDSTALPFIR